MKVSGNTRTHTTLDTLSDDKSHTIEYAIRTRTVRIDNSFRKLRKKLEH